MVNREIRVAEKNPDVSAEPPSHCQVGIQHKGSVDQGSTVVEGTNHEGKCEAGLRKCHGVVGTESCRCAGQSFRFSGFPFTIDYPTICLSPDVAIRTHPVGGGKILVDADRLLKILQRLKVGLFRSLIDIRQTS